nr:MAG TPA: hypothetical protein [Caudoviricetes sp.]
MEPKTCDGGRGMSDERVPSIDEVASIVNDAGKALSEGFVRALGQTEEAMRRLIEGLDPKWLRRRRRALARSRRNNLYLKSVGRCR